MRVWRTGELPAPPLSLERGGPAVELPRRVWIDTDAACGRGRTTDPDDCFALLLLARSPAVTVVGISTVHGNAPLAVTDSIARDLAARLGPGSGPPVHRGSAGPIATGGGVAAPAHEALRAALADGPLTIVALGPLTNVALALGGAPALRHRVGRLVAVAGRRPGHIFHPAEGAGSGILFGHGPVFTDFNHAQDREATARVLGLGLPVTLVPYEAARQMTLDSEDLDRIAQASEAGNWVVERARGWLDYWRTDIGREGFYPFDLVGAAYVLRLELFDCARTRAWVTEDERLWRWVRTPVALLAGDSVGRGRSTGGMAVIYCQNIRSSMRSWLLDALTSGARSRGGRESSAPSW